MKRKYTELFYVHTPFSSMGAPIFKKKNTPPKQSEQQQTTIKKTSALLKLHSFSLGFSSTQTTRRYLAKLL